MVDSCGSTASRRGWLYTLTLRGGNLQPLNRGSEPLILALVVDIRLIGSGRGVSHPRLNEPHEDVRPT